ncbi:recombinase family protein [Couchioplanes caeruleus]|uniref:Recombinase n=2 Tax=Couchioplanes caeruleus TaxID=56438 RepID=A0A1K0FD44_9ACTN|nr:recombinase family protein [Couchioplanes caeruleus]OJF10745.1 recombinase [Couchioplanes caeruleus subsp. caeruleus]ROP28155.1 DNA invertase Pin-like site-specific DNA recombinase [Couchioplanes caeruleus]
MRFAFYGRVSTEDQQDPQASKAWQLSRARSLIEPAGGGIVAEFFDIGLSRSLPWKRRPEALRLLDTIKSPSRDFDAVVIGEPQRAFYGSQFGMTFPIFIHYGVGLWVPEVGGAVDPGSDAHDLVMALYGGMSKGERNRIKIRVRSAMKAQTELEGRYLGGRPPYGYRLTDAGPHPNPGKAGEGKRLHKLEPDPITAPVVERIFVEYIAGRGMTSIARGLTQDGIPCPSAYDRGRNPHRRTEVWETTAIRAILQNPRYTGRQVWNRARTDEVLIDVDDVALGHEARHRWNHPSEWVWSNTEAHTPLISTDVFERAQQTVKARGTRGDAGKAPRRSRHPYLFRGLLRCALCGRVMAGSVNHGRIYYRCKASRDYVRQHEIAHPPVLYVRQESITDPVDRFLSEELGQARLPDTLRRIADASHRAALAEHQKDDEAPRLRTTIAECDAKTVRYRATLDAGGDPALVAGWISETTAIKKAAQARLGLTQVPPERMTEQQIAAIVEAFGGLLGLLRRAERQDRAEIYTRIGLQMIYRPGTETVLAEVRSKEIDRVPVWCPRGDRYHNPTGAAA